MVRMRLKEKEYQRSRRTYCGRRSFNIACFSVLFSLFLLNIDHWRLLSMLSLLIISLLNDFVWVCCVWTINTQHRTRGVPCQFWLELFFLIILFSWYILLVLAVHISCSLTYLCNMPSICFIVIASMRLQTSF